jgi:hypothetical protein
MGKFKARLPSGRSNRLGIACLTLLSLIYGRSPLPAEVFGDFTYESLPGGVSIVDYPEVATGDVEIPKEIDGKRVTSIGAFAFADCRWLSSVTMPESVTSIGEMAFHRCIHLENVHISSNVTTIGRGAFGVCIALLPF